jgi:hypothetical protein
MTEAGQPSPPNHGQPTSGTDDGQADPEDRHRLTTLSGLAALSLDALSSVAYGPEAIVLVLVGAGAAGLGYTLPVTLVICRLHFRRTIWSTQS